MLCALLWQFLFSRELQKGRIQVDIELAWKEHKDREKGKLSKLHHLQHAFEFQIDRLSIFAMLVEIDFAARTWLHPYGC